MDAMKRLLMIVLGVGLTGLGIGCNHMAGVCDCDPGPFNHAVPIAAVPDGGTVRTTEPPKVMDSTALQAATLKPDK
jgi:hypothetical protein